MDTSQHAAPIIPKTTRTRRPGSGRRTRPAREPSFLEAHRSEYAEQVKVLLLCRVVIVVVCLAILLVYEEGSPRLFAAAYAALVGGLAVAAAQLVWVRFVRDLERFVLVGLSLDMALATALAYLTGGIYNVGFAYLYFAIILAAALLLSDAAGFACASAATIVMALIAVAYWTASSYPIRLPLVAAELVADLEPRWGRVTANLLGVMLAYHGVAFLGSRLPHRITRLRVLYGEVMEQLRDGLVAIDRRGRIVLVNGEVCRLLNWGAPGNLLGRRFEEVLRRREDRTVLELLTRGEDVQSELELLIRDRGPQPVEVVTTVLRDPRGRVRGVIGIFRDMTLKQRLLEMENRVAQLSGSEEMALGIAHEIRTPLASIRGAIQELASHAFEDESDRRLSEIVRRESDRLDRMLQEFLDFARMRPPLRAPIDLVDLVEETVVLLGKRDGAGGIEVTCSADGAYEVDGDPDLLRQALLNVGNNALDALGPGGRLELQLGEVELPERTEGPERRLGSRRGVEVAVSDDSGDPVPAEDRTSRIFLPFYSTKRRGLGLGLALTQKILRLHGGEIVCEPSALGGTCFRIRLPLRAEPEDDELTADGLATVGGHLAGDAREDG